MSDWRHRKPTEADLEEVYAEVDGETIPDTPAEDSGDDEEAAQSAGVRLSGTTTTRESVEGLTELPPVAAVDSADTANSDDSSTSDENDCTRAMGQPAASREPDLYEGSPPTSPQEPAGGGGPLGGGRPEFSDTMATALDVSSGAIWNPPSSAASHSNSRAHIAFNEPFGRSSPVLGPRKNSSADRSTMRSVTYGVDATRFSEKPVASFSPADRSGPRHRAGDATRGGDFMSRHRLQALEPQSPSSLGREDESEDLASTLTSTMVKTMVEKYPAVEEAFKALRPVGVWLSAQFDVVAPYFWHAWQYVKAFVSRCPLEIATALTGLVLCFFGGAFVTLIAAFEAFRLCGGSRTILHLKAVYRDYKRVQIANRREALLNPDKKQTASDFLVRAMKSVRDPDRLSQSVAGVYTAMLGVFTTLRLQFARTITLGVSIGDMLKGPVVKYCRSALENLVDEDFRKWIPTIIDWTCRMLGVSVAFYAQRVMAAFQSSLRGGLMCMEATLSWLRSHKYIPLTARDKSVDMAAGYALAALGLYCQLHW
eukprot:gene21419-32942_t